jgi:predicted alpha/beta-fold hydrolase
MNYIKKIRPHSILVGVGTSLGAGILGSYVALSKDDCVLTAAVSIGCHFDCEKAMKFMSSAFFGFYDLVLGFYTKMCALPIIKQIDLMNEKTHPERVVGDDVKSVYTLT